MVETGARELGLASLNADFRRDRREPVIHFAPIMLQCMSPLMAHRVIRGAATYSVAIGVTADIAQNNAHGSASDAVIAAGCWY